MIHELQLEPLTSMGMTPSGPDDVVVTVAEDVTTKGDQQDIKAPPQTADQISQVQTRGDQLMTVFLSGNIIGAEISNLCYCDRSISVHQTQRHPYLSHHRVTSILRSRSRTLIAMDKCCTKHWDLLYFHHTLHNPQVL